jgi:hypothetical protein
VLVEDDTGRGCVGGDGCGSDDGVRAGGVALTQQHWRRTASSKGIELGEGLVHS